MIEPIITPAFRVQIRAQAQSWTRNIVTKAPFHWAYCHERANNVAKHIEAALRQDGRITEDVIQDFVKVFYEETWREMSRIRGAMTDGGCA